MNLIYDIHDKPKPLSLIVFAFQQLLAIIAATILVPLLVNANSGTDVVVMDQAAALFGAGAGTIVYLLITKFRSPVFLGSSFAFIAPLAGAAVFGYFGIMLGAVFAGGVYVIISIIIKLIGINWVDKLLPPVIIGPTVALIGLSLCGSAINNLNNTAVSVDNYNLVAILCGIITFIVTILCSVKGSKGLKLIPFIIGILSGYAVASIFTVIGNVCGIDYLKLVDFTPLTSMDSIFRVPNFTIVEAINQGFEPLGGGSGVASVALLFAPVAFVVLAEHIADHKNLSSIIDRDLIKDPGLDKTVMGDGVGSIVGSIFGGCPNTTYGESVGCIAITGNASIITIFVAAIMCMILAFFNPFVQFINTIPSCIIGGICIALYGFIAVSGLKMLQGVNLGEEKNLFVVSSILVTGIGGLTLNFGAIQITSIATALILGIIVNLILNSKKKDDKAE